MKALSSAILIVDGDEVADTLRIELRGNPAMYLQDELDGLADNFASLLQVLSQTAEQPASQSATAGPAVKAAVGLMA